MNSLFSELKKGIWKENPVLVLMLGMCPTLAVSTSARNALGMGIATTFVLAGSNLVISAVRKVIPDKVRIPSYIVIIAVFVTIIEMLIAAWAPAIQASLGLYIPLIVVNCIVLGRAEAFASKNGLFASLLDGLGMGLGFTLALLLLGLCREFLSAGTLFGLQAVPGWPRFALLTQPSGAFIVLALFLALINRRKQLEAKKRGHIYIPPEINCSNCHLCLKK